MNRGRIADKIFKRKIEPTQTSSRRNLNRLLTFRDEKIHCQNKSFPVNELCQKTNTISRNIRENQMCSIKELGIKIDL